MEIAVGKKRQKKTTGKVPDYLVYEVVKGKPVYYKGYKDVLNKTKTFGEITMESTLQAWLKSRLTILLGNFLLLHGYDLTTGEQGLILSKEDKRGADMAIFKEGTFAVDEHFSRVPPEIILEIDIRADTENTTEFDYVLEKIADYHKFGVKKVIWIFTKSRKVMDATAGQPWLTLDWENSIEVMDGLTVNLAELVATIKGTTS